MYKYLCKLQVNSLKYSNTSRFFILWNKTTNNYELQRVRNKILLDNQKMEITPFSGVFTGVDPVLLILRRFDRG